MEYMELIIGTGIVFTSTLSGIMGMGGGMLLMLLLISLLPIEWAMVVHGITQMAANGSRAYLHRSDIESKLIIRYLVGSVVAFALFKWLNIIPSKKLIFLLLGSFPFLSLIPHIGKGFSIEKPLRPEGCGFLVTIAQLLAGVSGGILDVFYLQSRLNRFQIIAGKAMTQTLAHGFKVAFFGPMFLDTLQQETTPINLIIIPLAIALAALGSYLGKQVLTRISENNFRKHSQSLILLIAAGLILRGLQM